MHHTAESDSGVCITLLSQSGHREIKIESIVGLWLLLKEHFDKILFFVNTAIMGEETLSIKCGDSLSLTFWLSGVMHTVESESSNFMIENLRKKIIFLACLSKQKWV